MLHCQVNGIPPVTVQWRHNGLLLPQDRQRTTVVNGSLLIGHFQKTKSDGSSDEGDYECVAQNSFGLVVSRRARIQAASKSRLARRVASFFPELVVSPASAAFHDLLTRLTVLELHLNAFGLQTSVLARVCACVWGREERQYAAG